MSFLDTIFGYVWDITFYFYDLYIESRDIPLVGSAISSAFYYIYRAFFNLLTPIAQASSWVYNIEQQIREVVSLDTVWSYFRSWFEWAEWAYSWVRNATSNIWSVINSWWSSQYYNVLSLIEEAKRYAESLVNTVESTANSLLQDWSSFVSSTLPNLADWSGVQSLINSTLVSWFPFYNELTSLWSEIRTFISDPEDYIYKKLDSFFERFW